MKAIPFIKTMLNEEYRLYSLQEFNHEKIEDYFKDWKMKDMIGWNKFVNYNSKSTIEFYGKDNPYKIKNPEFINGSELTLPYPNTIEDFICDCHRCSVDLNWHISNTSIMNRIYFMEQSELAEYNKRMLHQIEKS